MLESRCTKQNHAHTELQQRGTLSPFCLNRMTLKEFIFTPTLESVPTNPVNRDCGVRALE